MRRTINRVTKRGRVSSEIKRGVNVRSRAVETGRRFEEWCVKMGRTAPPRAIVQALNRSMDEGTEAIKALAATDPEVFRNYTSFLAGRGSRV